MLHDKPKKFIERKTQKTSRCTNNFFVRKSEFFGSVEHCSIWVLIGDIHLWIRMPELRCYLFLSDYVVCYVVYNYVKFVKYFN
jgi:hypothetical protein